MKPGRIPSAALALAVVAALASPRRAQAEEPFPEAVQGAAGLDCVPSCTLCHTTNPGMKGTWVGKAFGRYIASKGIAVAGTPPSAVAAAVTTFLSDPEQTLGAARLKSGLDPDTGLSLCGPTYGCGARVAKRAPQDDWSGLTFVGGAMLFGVLLRRYKRR